MTVKDEKTTLIIGGTGSLGKRLIAHWKGKRRVIVYSRDEAKHWTIRNELVDGGSVEFQVGDVRDRRRLIEVIDCLRPSTIVVAAALKQVDTCELAPYESLLTNALGTQNVIEAVKSAHHAVNTVLFVSTDKACSPVNVYGMCKALSERLITSQSRNRGTRWLCTRYGNVLESRGSIIPLFKYQVENGLPLTVTNPNMTRFMMTLDEAVSLIEKTLDGGSSGETWIPSIASMKISDLAEIFAETFSSEVKIIGPRPGEKIHEELINEEEATRCRRDENQRCFVVQPSYVTPGLGASRFRLSSDLTVLQKPALKGLLTALGLLARPLSGFDGRKIEEIVTSQGRTA